MLSIPPTQPVAKQPKVIMLLPMAVVKSLASIILFLMLAYIAGMFYERQFYPEPTTLAYTLIRSFDLNHEANVPAFFSTTILLLASLLLFFIYKLKKANRQERSKWVVLSCVFLFMAIDENLQIHEYMSDVVRPMLRSDLSGLLYWAWVVPYGVLVIAAGMFFLPFVLQLPVKTRLLFIFSGAIFVAGALGLELFEGYFYVRYGYFHIYNLVLYCMEEVLEMSGVVLFIYALLDYLTASKARVLFCADRDTNGETVEYQAQNATTAVE